MAPTLLGVLAQAVCTWHPTRRGSIMRSAVIRFGTFLLCALAAFPARADPIVVATTTFTTSGLFDCRGYHRVQR